MSRPSVSDAQLSKSTALPTGASSVTQASGLDINQTTNGDFLVPTCELLISAPAVTTGMLADAATIKYDVVTSANSDLSSPTIIAATVLTQTGAGGAGAAAASVRFALPSDVKRYVGVKATKSGAGDASSVSVTAQFVF